MYYRSLRCLSYCTCVYKIHPNQLSSLSSSVAKLLSLRAECSGFESHLRQLFLRCHRVVCLEGVSVIRESVDSLCRDDVFVAEDCCMLSLLLAVPCI